MFPGRANETAKDEMVKLGVRYNIASRNTSFVAIFEQSRVDVEGKRSMQVPLAAGEWQTPPATFAAYGCPPAPVFRGGMMSLQSVGYAPACAPLSAATSFARAAPETSLFNLDGAECFRGGDTDGYKRFSKKKCVQSSATGERKKAVEAPRQLLVRLIRAQRTDGSWPTLDAVLEVLAALIQQADKRTAGQLTDFQVATNKLKVFKNCNMAVLATCLALALFEHDPSFTPLKSQWQLLANKGSSFLRNSNKLFVDQCAGEFKLKI